MWFQVRGGQKRNLWEIWGDESEQQLLLSESLHDLTWRWTERRLVCSSLSSSSAPYPGFLPNCWSCWPTAVPQVLPQRPGSRQRQQLPHRPLREFPLHSPMSVAGHAQLLRFLHELQLVHLCQCFRRTECDFSTHSPNPLLDLHFLSYSHICVVLIPILTPLSPNTHCGFACMIDTTTSLGSRIPR